METYKEKSFYKKAGYAIGTYPKPIDLQTFSLNTIVSNITSSKSGGGATILSNYM